MVRSPDGDTAFFDVTIGVLQGDTLAPYLFVICLDYVLRKAFDANKELGFTLSKSRSRRHPAVKLTDVDYADDLAIISDYLTDGTILLHQLEQASSEIGLYIDAKKTEFICYKSTPLGLYQVTQQQQHQSCRRIHIFRKQPLHQQNVTYKSDWEKHGTH